MKKILISLIATLVIIGCSNQPVAMKLDRKYFAPARQTTMAKSSTSSTTKVKSLTAAQKKINEKDTMIELLRKENKELRERIQRLEKKLQIQNS
ncbi:MAG: hypothetical protein WCW40_00275 [Bacteroidota bacterium]